ncbi:MAG TPA: hypothetical protein PLK28_12045 [Candidatus Rifleibacterium sp.]|nr:hypothetical protein [Candidatus Rifleibacterium sp.]
MKQMNQLTSSSTSFDKLKTIFFLGLTCNLTTFVGCTAVWVALARNEWAEGIIDTALAVLAFAPIFMGDAINNYTLGRIRLEFSKGWDDVQISVRGREKVARFYQFYRLISILPAYLLAAAFVYSHSSNVATVQSIKLAFLCAWVVNLVRASYLLQKYIAPRLPAYGGVTLLKRVAITAAIFGGWYWWFFTASGPASKMAVFGSGMLYFLITALMHPLPTRFSLMKPGKPASKQAFFRVELLSDEQLQAIPGGGIFNDELKQPFFEAGFIFHGNLRMPLIELPLFQAWGIAMLSEDGKTLGLLLDTEVKKGPYRSLLSFSADKTVITTDFGSGQAKFPAGINYKLVERSLQKAEMLKLHRAKIDDSFISLKDNAWQKLEETVKNILRFLESETAERRKAAAANRANDPAASAQTVPAPETPGTTETGVRP